MSIRTYGPKSFLITLGESMHDRIRAVHARPSLTTILLIIGVTLAIVAGIRGILTPSGTVSQAVGYIALVLATGYIGAGFTTLTGALTKSRRVEAVGLTGIALLTLLHGTIIILAAPDTADLTGLRIIGAAFITLALMTARLERGISRVEIGRINDIHDDLTNGSTA